MMMAMAMIMMKMKMMMLTMMINSSILNVLLDYETFLQYLYFVPTPAECETYSLYAGVCKIPSNVSDASVPVANTTRSVCRQLCSGMYDMECSGFFFHRDNNTCQLTPYTGEYVSRHANCMNTSIRVEYYRRTRCSG